MNKREMYMYDYDIQCGTLKVRFGHNNNLEMVQYVGILILPKESTQVGHASLHSRIAFQGNSDLFSSSSVSV